MQNISISPCPNDTFSFYHYLSQLDQEKTQVFFADIQKLNERALANDGDIIKVSFAVYPLIQEKYIILDSGAALGQGCGPLLISKKKTKAEDIKNLRIAIPGINTSANRLFRLFFPDHPKCVFTTYEKVLPMVESGEVDAGVIIHENRFTYQSKGLLLAADLGEMWAESYGDLLPLGGIVAKRSLGNEKIKLISDSIADSVQWAFQNKHHIGMRKFIKEHAQELDDEVINQHIGLYVNEHSVQLGEKGRNAIKSFLSKELIIDKPCFITEIIDHKN